MKLYVEGGGDSTSLHSKCREGFRKFLERAGFKGKMPRIVACGSRQNAYDSFNTACEKGEQALLLIDSEDRVTGHSPWNHLTNRPGDGFAKPNGVTDDDCHFMVVCMESWFLADKEALEEYFGQGFKRAALPQNPDIESVRKEDVYAGMENATRNCKTKARYGKGKHSFELLMRIAPAKVRSSSPWAERFLDALDSRMN